MVPRIQTIYLIQFSQTTWYLFLIVFNGYETVLKTGVVANIKTVIDRVKDPDLVANI
jgi:hypothetical protein